MTVIKRLLITAAIAILFPCAVLWADNGNAAADRQVVELKAKAFDITVQIQQLEQQRQQLLLQIVDILKKQAEKKPAAKK